jgi:hypothetical protein
MAMKRAALAILILAVCSAVVFVDSTNASKKTTFEFEKAAGGLYYLFWCEGEESVDLAREQFQKDFDLTDKDMGDLSRLSAKYYFEDSDLFYNMQNQVGAASGLSFDSYGSLNQAYLKESKRISELYLENVHRIVKDDEKLIQWMSDFNKNDSAARKSGS